MANGGPSTLELDHLIVFRSGPPSPPPGLLLDDGTRHTGQGTRNRRIVFARSFVELLWIDDPAAERASGLGFAQRCRQTAYPYGLVLRGVRPEGRFRSYTVPHGPTLAVHDGTPDMPFLTVFDMTPEQLAATGPRATPAHPCGATDITTVELVGATPPLPGLPGITLPDDPPAALLHLTGGRTSQLRI